jgi:glycosyltransferase involved in cell wall biosynthesis
VTSAKPRKAMTVKPTLTVGIPTYNGSAYIRNALDSVINQISVELISRVDILISDNASTDDTPEIINHYQTDHTIPIHYSRNFTNIGYDKNVDALFKKASGDFVWMLADDDTLKEGALVSIFKLLDDYPSLNAVLVNFDQYDRKLETIIDIVELPDDQLCKDAETFLHNSKARYNLLSALIIRKDKWNNEDLSMGYGTNYIHIYGLFKILLQGDSFILKKSLVNMRMGSALWNGSGDALIMILLDSGSLIRSMKPMGYNKKIIHHLLKDARNYTYNSIPSAKLLGIQNKWLITKKLIVIYNTPALWIKYIPLIFCPDSIFKRLHPLKKSFSQILRSLSRKLWLSVN